MGQNQKRQDRSGRGRSSSSGTRGSKAGSDLKAPILREFSSGGVVFKKENGEVLWLLAKTTPSLAFPKSIWRLPKGWIDNLEPGTPGLMASGKVKADEESLRKTATREVAEEGGVKAKIIKKIGTTNYFYKNPNRGKVFKFVTFYLMEWEKDIPEGFDRETSEISWLSFEEASKTLALIGEKNVLKKAKEILDSGITESLI